MCGIVYAQSFDGTPVNNGILEQFDAQRNRGTQGFGLFDGQFMNMVRAAKEDKILKWLVKYDSNLIMFHHRNPTSTVNVKRAAHPFSTKKYFGNTQYIMVHNGVISNADELYDKHEEMGIEYQSLLDDGTFNDSEALLWDLALTLDGKQPELTARGQIAFVCIKTEKGALERMFFGRNNNPLKLFRHKDGIALSSEGEGEMIDSQKLYNFNYKLRRLTTKDFTIPSYNYATTGYSTSAYEHKPWHDEEYWRGYSNACNTGQLATQAQLAQDADFYDFDQDGNLIDEERELDLYRPEMAEVENKALRYILDAEGRLDDAYYKAEFDYESILSSELDDHEIMKDMLLMERVLAYINNDPEYVDRDSVSSIWSALWTA